MSDENKNITEDYHLSDNQMSIAADAMMSDEYDALSNDISNHIEVCSECKSKLFTLVDVLTQMHAEPVRDLELNVDSENNEPNLPQWTKLAVAAAILVFTLAGIYHFQKINDYKSEIAQLEESLGKTDQSKAEIIDSLIAEIESNKSNYKDEFAYLSDSLNELNKNLNSVSNLLAEAFYDNKLFEDQIAMNLRSTLIEVNSPKHIEQSYGEKVELSWKTSNSSTMQIAIYNNKEILVLRGDDIDSPFILDSSSLLPGVYYWKLISVEGVAFIGKIVLD